MLIETDQPTSYLHDATQFNHCQQFFYIGSPLPVTQQSTSHIGEKYPKNSHCLLPRSPDLVQDTFLFTP